MFGQIKSQVVILPARRKAEGSVCPRAHVRLGAVPSFLQDGEVDSLATRAVDANGNTSSRVRKGRGGAVGIVSFVGGLGE